MSDDDAVLSQMTRHMSNDVKFLMMVAWPGCSDEGDMTQMSWYVRMFEIYLSEKSSCLQCDLSSSWVSSFFNLSKNQCLHYHNTIVHGSSLIPQSSPIYAYLQKAALTLRLILEALPIPSRRHRLRVWVTYLSIKVLLRRSPGWVSSFFHKILTTLILNLFP